MRRTMTEVRTFNVRLYCDCGGEYQFNGNAHMSSPPQYVHLCLKCGSIATFGESYPTTETVEVGEETTCK